MAFPVNPPSSPADGTPHGRTGLFEVEGRAERRQLTILFCDMVGSTVLSRELDPEDLRRLMLRFQEAVRASVERFGGRVARYMGDGVLAYFGFPLAHEDDPVRAIHAALDILGVMPSLATVGVRAPQIRAGIATGIVVVGDLIGEAESREIAAVGEAVHLAARLQAAAEAGSVLVSERTHELAAPCFVFEALPPQRVKGFDEDVTAWRPLRALTTETRFVAFAQHGVAPFVGRERERERLFAQWREVGVGVPCVATIVGDAGIGKSRLAEELARGSAGSSHHVLRCQCSPFHTSSALFPFVRLLQRSAGIAPGDDGAGSRRRLEDWLARTRRPRVDEQALRDLLGLPTSDDWGALTPLQRRMRTLGALERYLRHRAARSPLLLIFEDAHWADPSSMELIDALAAPAPRSLMHLVVTSREPLPALQARPHALHLALARLPQADAIRMVESLFPGHPPPAPVIEEIVRITDGVPLYLEEFAKTIDPGTGAWPDARLRGAFSGRIPLTLRDSLMERLDRLGPAKQVAQVAAVVGREIPRRLLDALAGIESEVVGAATDELTACGVLVRSEESGGDSFVFRHALLQEAAYDSLLRSRRQDLHGRIAAHLERSATERPTAEPEVLAHHYALAGEPLRAAGHAAVAAQRALERSANQEALQHASWGLAQAAELPEGDARDRAELALAILQGTAFRAVEGFASDKVRASFAAALSICNRLGDPVCLLDAHRGLYAFHYSRGELLQAEGHAHRIAQLAEATGHEGIRMIGAWMLGVLSFWKGDYVAAQRDLERAVALYEAGGHQATTLGSQIDPAVNARSHMAWNLWLLGRPEQARATAARALADARHLSQPLALAMALFYSCACAASAGDTSALAAPLDELFAVTDEHRLGYFASCAKVLRGHQLIDAGDPRAGVAMVACALREFEQQRAHLGLPWTLSILARGHAAAGDRDRALAAIDEALAAMARDGERQWEIQIWLAKAVLLGESGAAQEAAEALACAGRIAQARGVSLTVPHAADSLREPKPEVRHA
ncbi:adenylate/guanylate cyclase domain-containing protein [Variovorax defluvii]|uniref:Adenylate/guanylate cyclase domain-containing protein n=1 Tax=Variovorax defluvii TaxID=913761 RepID=A0ABP8HLG5_9BURK